MAYNFDKVIERRKSNSMKWNVAENELPMWIADMDFQTAPEVIDAIKMRADQGCFGYTEIPEKWYQAYINWWKNRHDFVLQKEWLMFCTGVVPAISSIVRKLTTPAEKVLVQTPVYNIFFNSILNNGRQIVENPLKFDGAEYQIDFEDLQRKLSDPQTTMMILCNPHNPIGKIWDRATLEKIGELCFENHVVVVSDEIHCDLTDPGMFYVPFASVSDICRNNSITCVAPTKAFNLAGLQTAAISVPNDVLRHKVWRGINTDEVAEPNAFAVDAAIAAFTQGDQWLDNVRTYIYENKQYAVDFVKNEIPQAEVISSDATYLLWIYCKNMIGTAAEAATIIRESTGLYLSAGSQFSGNGADFLRMNIACPRSVLKDGLQRLKVGIQTYEREVLKQC